MGLWDWLKHAYYKERRMPGVIYSEDYIPEDFPDMAWKGSTSHMIVELANEQIMQMAVPSPATIQAGPEDIPYTVWERLGLIPIHPSRMRARQYYMPITDFTKYGYDDASPEENELRSRWLAHLYTFNTAVPAAVLCVGGCCVLPLHTIYRLPLLFCIGVTGVFAEATRIYVGALRERQDLDDFLVCKEFWYIKNDEVYELAIPTIPRGQESFYQSRIDPITGSPVYRAPGEFAEEQDRKKKEMRKRFGY